MDGRCHAVIFRYSSTTGSGGYQSSYQSGGGRDANAATGGRTEPAPRFTSRFLKNKSVREEQQPSYSSGGGHNNNDGKYGSDNKGLLRSRTSANLDEDMPTDDGSNVSAYSPYAKSHYGSDLSRSRSSHALKSRETSPDRPVSSHSGTVYTQLVQKAPKLTVLFIFFIKDKTFLTQIFLHFFTLLFSRQY